ncbi:MAG TPA: FAD-dependent oxidoreductase [bacterium]|nr:FAD-dependent oxidoreductase [bacterium]HOL49180.1 FAD-dependent oxidoreductase [bacterium]HPO52414.1 FAD-dependent oxidoreductase [bacterium]
MTNYLFDKSYDIVVVGGGLSGIGYAIAAASGKKVLVIERRSSLGWEVSTAFSSEFNGKLSKTGKILKKELESRHGIKKDKVSPALFEISLESILKKMNIDIMFYTYPLDIIKRDDLIAGLIAGNKNGAGIISSRIFIDATENFSLLKKCSDRFMADKNYSHIYYIFFNGVKKEIKDQEIVNRKINDIEILSIKKGFRKGEVFAEIETRNKNITETRIQIPTLISFLKENIDFLKESLVSHISNEPVCSKPQISCKFSSLMRNLYPVIYSDDDKQNSSLVVQKFEAGTKTADSLKNIDEIFPDDISVFECERYTNCDEKFEFDVVVAGGGTAGAVAAISSAREGIKTAVVEHSNCLGGIGTGGGIHHYYFGMGGGLQKEIEEKSSELTKLFTGKFKIHGWHPEAKKIVLEEMCKNAGVKVFYGNCCIDVEMKVNAISGIYCATADGMKKYKANVVIDATGDGDIAAKAGAPFTLGRVADKLPQPFTLVPVVLTPDGTFAYINFDSGFVDPTDTLDLTRARRQSLMLFEKEITNELDIPLYICPIIGIRQGRQILGKYVLTLTDQIFGARFSDAVCSMDSHYDNHSKDMENQSFQSLLWRWLTDNFMTRIECEIPYRCLLPLNVKGLIVTGRAISMDPEAHYALRMEKDMERLGEVAGIAASISVKNGVFPEDIDIKKLQEKLKASGCWNPDYMIKSAININSSFEDLKQKFLSKDFKEPVSIWTFNFSEKVEKFLNAILKKPDDTQLQFWSTTILSIHKKKSGVKFLIEWLKENKDINSQLCISIITILGRTKDSMALDLLHGILFDKNANADTLIATIRAIGEMRNEKSIAAIDKFLKRKDIPNERILSQGVPGLIKKVKENALWQIELACAETLKKLGNFRNEIVDKYLSDTRAYVRNYAKMIMDKQGVAYG